MRLRPTAVAAVALLQLLLLLWGATATADSRGYRKPPRGHAGQCVGTPERPTRLLKLPSGQNFCLRLPRFARNPETDSSGTKVFVRTWNDTCGLYSIVLSKFVPPGKGPPPHVHYAEDEFFLPGTPGDVVRIHAQAQDAGPYREYKAGQVPGINMAPIKVGGVEVPYGSIGWSPINTPHTWKSATSLTNFMAIWGFGWAMVPAVRLADETDAQKVLYETGLLGNPTDITGAMFGGPQFVEKARGALAIPGLQWSTMLRLQRMFDEGEKCCPSAQCGEPGPWLDKGNNWTGP